MTVFNLLIILSILVAGFFLAAYLWSVSSAQLDHPIAHSYGSLSDPIPRKKNKPYWNDIIQTQSVPTIIGP